MQRSYKEMNGHQANGGAEQEVQPGDVQAGWGKPFPSLHLWPLQDTFQMKMIHLPEGQRIKIGRQTNPKTQPGERNAYFDSKVLSRLHAEIWEHDGKIYIKDVKSSNGTFINNERLSPESVESDPYPLKHEDIVEFGIDIVGDDNRSILHHKVAAKVYCVFNVSDAALSARELANYSDHRNPRRQHSGQSNGGPGPRAAPQSSLGPLVLSSGGKVNGLSFDQIYSRLHHEMQMSKELGGSLQTLSDSMTDIQDNLGGGLPPSQNGSAAEFIPIQYRETSAEAKAALASPHGQQAAAVINLQNQLTQTQNSLTGHLDKIRQLEDQFKDHETLKHEVTAMREQMEGSQREMKMLLSSKRGRQMFGRGQLNGDDDYDDDQNAASDDDDTRSVVTLMDNEDAQERVRTRRRSEKETRSKSSERSASPSGSTNGDRSHHDKEVNGNVVKENAELVAKIEIMSNEIAEVVQLSKNLQTQHGEAMNAVKVLTQRVTELEGGIADRISAEVNKVENKWEMWKTKCEDGWRRDRESWDVERERLRGVVREWEEASRRAYEEEEDRELNERLSSEDDYEDDDDDEEEDEGEGEEDEGEGHDRGSKAVKSGEGMLNGEWATVLDPNNPISPMGLKTGSPSGSLRKSASTKRGRRPSHRTLLAIRGIQAVADPEASGNSTPKAEAQAIMSEDAVPDASPKGIASRLKSKELSKSGKARRRNRENTIYGSKDGREIKRNGSQETFKQEKDSSESGKESGDTLKESDKIATASGRKMKKLPEQQQGLRQPIPIFTVFIVAAVAGAIYYKHKE